MFFKCKTQADCKALFRSLAKRLHPDHGGTPELMILLQEAYDIHLSKISRLDAEKRHFEPKQNTKSSSIIESGDERLEIFDEMGDWYLDNPKVNLDFFESVFDYYQTNNFITVKQYEALKKIYYLYHMGNTQWD